jgi:hypothetical protein
LIRAEATYADLSTVRLVWRLTGENFACPVSVYVMKSPSFTGPYALVSGAIEDSTQYLDPIMSVDNKASYYRLKIEVGGETLYHPEIGGVTIEPQKSNLMDEAIRQMILNLRLAGRKVLYYPIKSSGPWCHCYDEIEQTHDKKCLSCFGVKYMGGFFNPLVTYASISSQANQLSAESRTKDSPEQGAVPYLPLARQGDIIIERENQRWIVGSIKEEQWRRVTMRQTLFLFPVSTDSVVQELPVNWELLGIDENILEI